jgi:hypothetical protein
LIVSTVARDQVSANELLEILGNGKHTLHEEHQRSQSVGEDRPILEMVAAAVFVPFLSLRDIAPPTTLRLQNPRV